MKLFVDDLRDPPDQSWKVARSTGDALKLCRETWPTELSLDHDLGGEDRERVQDGKSKYVLRGDIR